MRVCVFVCAHARVRTDIYEMRATFKQVLPPYRWTKANNLCPSE